MTNIVTVPFATEAALLAVNPETAGWPLGTRAIATDSGLEWVVTGTIGTRTFTPAGTHGPVDTETVATSGGLTVTTGSVWGLTGNSRPYYDSARAASGEDARYAETSTSRPKLVTI